MALISWYYFFMEPVLAKGVCDCPTKAVVVAGVPPWRAIRRLPGEKGGKMACKRV